MLLYGMFERRGRYHRNVLLTRTLCGLGEGRGRIGRVLPCGIFERKGGITTRQ